MLLVVIQVYRPDHPKGGADVNASIENKYPFSPSVKVILTKACMDCHSNSTIYPWYAEVQPVRFWLDHHVEEGRGELNFDAFLSYSKKKQLHKLEEVIEAISEGWMPLNNYTWMHKTAVLSDVEKNELIDWTKQTMNAIKAE